MMNTNTAAALATLDNATSSAAYAILAIIDHPGREIPEVELFERVCAGRDYVEAAIDAMLDAGIVQSTVIDARETGEGYIPGLRMAA